jgi:hypothetical protein
LIESERIDALAASARAIAGLRSDRPHLVRKDVPHLSESLLIGIEKGGFVESPGGADLNLIAQVVRGFSKS